MQASRPLWEQFLLNAVGPLVTVVLGSVAVGGTVSWLQRRREARQALRDLTVDMFQVAFEFYSRVEDARRRRRHREPEPSVTELDAAYQEFAVAGRSIEARLRVAGSDENTVKTRWLWHCILDLLTVLFFHHRHSEQRMQDLIAGQQDEHDLTRARDSVPGRLLGRFLKPDELQDPGLVKSRFAQAMDELIMLRR